jgi:hypothetical protein
MKEEAFSLAEQMAKATHTVFCSAWQRLSFQMF